MIFTIFFVLLSLFPFLLSFQLPNDTIVSSRLLDAQLLDSAFGTFSRPVITGVPYDAEVPKALKGVKVSAIRFMSGSLWHRGVQMYKEFEIPKRVVGYPFVERLVLVYQNLGNLSNKFYPLPGYTYLAPILGLLPYNGTNLNVSHSMLPQLLQIRAYKNPILIKFSNVDLVQQFGGSLLAKCVYFGLNGSVQFDALLPNNVCSSFHEGHFSIVVESKSVIPPSSSPHQHDPNKFDFGFRILIIPCLVCGILLLVLLGVVVRVVVRRAKQGARIEHLEYVADNSEALEITYVGDTKLPSASMIRTRPEIENSYIC
ncbi:hypothetical protein PIB30_101986 [Stylosanthes scabra]|uniref:Uncharacterized protein n=1 Tax=Stylosanthes scabra TaxID=79078 RepID=A0ABU6XYC0_9FABA|nr:hypothetical protein [Stylosanthes scabra]